MEPDQANGGGPYVTVHTPSGSHAPAWEPYSGQGRVNSRFQGVAQYVPTPECENEVGWGVNGYVHTK